MYLDSILMFLDIFCLYYETGTTDYKILLNIRYELSGHVTIFSGLSRICSSRSIAAATVNHPHVRAYASELGRGRTVFGHH